MQLATHIANAVSVIAATILEVSEKPSGNLMLRLSDGRNYEADTSMTVRYCPVPGDYLVTQEDGYEYLNPKEVFERKYSPIPAILPADHPVSQIAAAGGGTVDHVARLPDGSGAALVSFPLPANHWLTQPGYNEPPMPFRRGTDDPDRIVWAEKIRTAARFAVRASTMNGADDDFDPDAVVQNMVMGMIGYWTPDGTTQTSSVEARPPVDNDHVAPGCEQFSEATIAANRPVDHQPV
jgi:hypothetical protein